ncbi:MAG: LytTR family DNA-binding domain-containing protein [Saccharofermentans sp.]|nr:LytTR family DNA-binding domain-containing protein [Saccharofermentans sp.]
MRFAICDDEKIFIEQFESVVYSVYNRLDIDLNKYSEGPKLLEDLDNGLQVDAYFLDIEMDAMDGMTLAGNIRKKLPNVPIIFLTSHLEMAIDGYEVGAFRFLKKPIEPDKVQQTIEDLKKFSQGRKGVVLKIDGEDTVIVPDDVLFLESENNDVRIITKNKTYAIRMKIMDAVETFNEVSNTFTKVHRSTAVNMVHVTRIREKDLVLDNGFVVAISRGCFKEFKETFYAYVKSSAR